MENMAKKMLIDATHAEETRVAVVDGGRVEEFDFESANKRQIAGNIYLARVTRIEPSLQAAFVEYGGNKHGFLSFSEIHPDYYKIPVADRKALIAEENARRSKEEDEEDASDDPPSGNGRRAGASKAESAGAGKESIDLGEADEEDSDAPEADAGDSDASKTPRRRRRGKKRGDSDDQVDSEGDESRSAGKSRSRRYKIQEVIDPRQVILVQAVKEERGNKGAALTTYISLAGRYCVLMPNTGRHGGVSRKITNVSDRKKLKKIVGELELPEGAGLIVRTAGSSRTKSEIKRDYEYLLRLWEQIRELTLKSVAPAQIYEEGNLVMRSIRDLCSNDIGEILVDGEESHKMAKDFMTLIMPSRAKDVKLHRDKTSLFAKHKVESFLNSMFDPVVPLKSGGTIVIGETEALVAIDVNSGKSTREKSVESTALKTNLEAAEEAARQMRMRDIAGLIVIDFIDMEERKNNKAVETRLRDCMKSDRARTQLGSISNFGLLEMSRQRLRRGMTETISRQCEVCSGTGRVRSSESLALAVLRQIEKDTDRLRSKEVHVNCPVGVANFLLNHKRDYIAAIEAKHSMNLVVEGDPSMSGSAFAVNEMGAAVRRVRKAAAPVTSVDAAMAEGEEQEAQADPAPEGDGDAPREGGGRRRRRSRGSRSRASAPAADDAAQATGEESEAPKRGASDDKPKPSAKRKPASSRAKRGAAEKAQDGAAAEAAKPDSDASAQVEKSGDAKKPAKKVTRTRAKSAKDGKSAKGSKSAKANKKEAKDGGGKATAKASGAKGADKPAAKKAPAKAAKTAESAAQKKDASKAKRSGWWSSGA